jgi:hypothetical protein
MADISYHINAQDLIIFVNDEWSRFAIDNAGHHLVREKVLNTSLWNVISDRTTEYFYRQILRRVRGGTTVQFRLRCDSPEILRLFEMRVSSLGRGEVEFLTRPLWMKERVAKKVFLEDTPRENNMIVACSWCNRIELGRGEWAEVEEAAEKLRIFQIEVIPGLTHGICEGCRKTMSAQIKS